ncbi:MAG: response regulator [Rhizobiaceae bacterium]|nr:response regulator [Rhizobiaceae bacterium]
MRLLIIDDSKSILLALRLAISEFTQCEVETFINPKEALERSQTVDFGLVIVDYMMPEIDGIEVIRRLRSQPQHQTVPIVMITSRTERSIRLEALEAGATDFLNKPFDTHELRARVSNLLALHQAQLELADRAKLLEIAREVAARQAEIREKETIWCLAQAMESRDGNTGDHVERVANVAELIADGLGMDKHTRRNIYIAAPLHDIGKIGISDAVLNKPGKLDADEMAEIRRHVPIGVSIMRKSSTELARVATAIIGGHHEKWDGSGYPLGISGDAIPLEARIVAVADVFDALCSERSYKAAWPPQRAYEEIIACSGSHFDPACVAAFKSKWPEIRALVESSQRASTVSEEDGQCDIDQSENRAAGNSR